MKIKFFGLSCFLLENKFKNRILLDPYSDGPKYSLGLKLPKTIKSELTLFSHLDIDHYSFRPEIGKLPKKKTKLCKQYEYNFPNLNLKGIVLPSWNNYPFIAWQFTLDNIRLWHLSDFQGVIPMYALKEAGRVDVLFISPNKVEGIESTLKTIELIKPKIVIWSHNIPPKPKTLKDEAKLKEYYTKFFKKAYKTNPMSIGSIKTFTEFWGNILEMNKKFDNVIKIDTPSITFSKYLLRSTQKPKILFFRSIAAE